MAVLLAFLISLNLILIILGLALISKIQQTVSLVKKSGAHKNTRLSKNLEKKLEEDFEKLILAAGKRIDRKLAEYFQKLVDDAVRKGTELSDFIEKQQSAIVKETQFLAARDIAKLKQDLEKYRAGQLAQIDQKVNQIAVDVAKQVLGKVIDVSTHEDLVKQALERAKKESFLENAKHGESKGLL